MFRSVSNPDRLVDALDFVHKVSSSIKSRSYSNAQAERSAHLSELRSEASLQTRRRRVKEKAMRMRGEVDDSSRTSLSRNSEAKALVRPSPKLAGFSLCHRRRVVRRRSETSHGLGIYQSARDIRSAARTRLPYLSMAYVLPVANVSLGRCALLLDGERLSADEVFSICKEAG